MRRFPLLLLTLLGTTGAIIGVEAACSSNPETLPPTGQIVLFVSTDAPLPPPAGTELAATDVTPLFDRLRIEIFKPTETTPCRDCTREFVLDRDLVKNAQASFGFVPPPNTAGFRARIALYRSIAVRQNAPMPNGAIVRIVSLPAVSAEGIVNLGVTLKVDDVGKTTGTLDAPVQAEAAKPDFSIVGSWVGSQRTKCKDTAKAGEVCVPGGAYWMGNPTEGAEFARDDVQTPRLVVLSPFFVDKTEVTVSAFRETGIARIDPQSNLSEDPREGQNYGDFNVYDPCNYTQSPGIKPAKPRTDYDDCQKAGDAGFAFTVKNPENSIAARDTDQQPVICISWAKSAEYCRAKGGDLMTEAQFEYLASGFKSQHYPWGNDEPTCEDTVYGRYEETAAKCRPPNAYGQPLPPGSGKRDRVALEGGEVVDLIGNVGEWTRDAWNRSDEPCWTSPLVHDPVCTTASTSDKVAKECPAKSDGHYGVAPVPNSLYSYRGGSWATTATGLRAADRHQLAPYGTYVGIGFRCARADK